MTKPKYIAIAAMTLDGKIAKDDKHLSTDWTSEEDKIAFRKLLKECDVVLIGKKTWETAKEPLSKRSCIVLTRSVESIKKENDLLTFVNTEKTNLKQFLVEQNYKAVAILGGAQVYTYCLENGMLDELYLTIEPIVFGKGIDLFAPSSSPPAGRSEVSASGGRGGGSDYKFELVSSERLNPQGSLLLRYKLLL